MRNETTLAALCRQLERNCGDELAAAKAVGVSLLFVNQWRKDDKVANERLTEAARVGTQGLVSAALQRAVHGIEEDVYYKGEVVGQKTVYSDGLLQTLLKAKVPEFAKDADGAGVNVNVQIANVMPRADTYQDWLRMKEDTVNRKSLPPPQEVEVIDVTPTNVFEGIEL